TAAGVTNTGLSVAEIAAIQTAVAAASPAPTDAAALQLIVDAAVTELAVETAAVLAAVTSAGNGTLTEAELTAAGVTNTGLSVAEIAAIQTAVAAASPAPTDAAALQLIVDAAVTELAAETAAVLAAVTSAGNGTLTEAELTTAGVTNTGLSATEIAAIQTAVAAASPAPTDAAALQLIVDGALTELAAETTAVLAAVTSAGNGTLTEAELTTAGVTNTGLSVAEIAAIQTAVAAASPAPTDAAALQLIVDAAVTELAAETTAVLAAVTSAGNGTLTEAELTAAGVTNTGLSVAEIAAIQTAVAAASPAPTDAAALQLIVDAAVSSMPITWNGTSNDWNDVSNWSTNTVPLATSNIVIPTGLTHYPTTSSALTVKSLTVESGASFIPQATVTGPVTFKRNLPAGNWHLVSSPVADATYEGIIANNTLAIGTGGNIGIGVYSNATGLPWDYATSAKTGTMPLGLGISIKLANIGDFSVTGIANISDVNQPITLGARTNFNLVGNPFMAYVNSKDFGLANRDLITEQTIWVWEGSEYVTYNATTPIEISPGQGFFVEAVADGDIIFAKSNQSHQASDTFKRESPRQSFELFVENEASKKSTKVFYIANKTTGFDNGYDSKMFGGVKASKLEVFTELITENKGNKLAIQSLPSTNMEAMVVPVGITAEAGKEVTFSVNAKNLPEGINIYLEDRVANTFTNISNKGYKVVLENAAKGTGQFYIHTTSKDLENVTIEQNLQDVSIYKSANNSVTITGLQSENASLNVYSMLGEKVISKQFKVTGVSVIELPKMAKGVYIVEVISNSKKITKKIILE
ncbi:T9SS type A sorting domain-containing protein, partial [Tenacibaculum finnmarkense genomovar finnmarkense]|uniref:T9SS type A sorting domain-containing protein n=8 Tax=Tenacibaculum finnmarkense TaxID=2781243 RepID=UPI001EFB92B4